MQPLLRAIDTFCVVGVAAVAAIIAYAVAGSTLPDLHGATTATYAEAPPLQTKRFYDRLDIEDENGTHRPGTVVLAARADGHFYAPATVNGGRSLEMFVDTGATLTSLSYDAAAAAGINVRGLSFTAPVQTANGIAYAAETQLASLQVGDIVVSNLPIRVGSPGTLTMNILGMNFMNRLTNFNISQGALTMELGNPPVYRPQRTGS